jgi:parvulin-like peptidyl-prolyl isomerase
MRGLPLKKLMSVVTAALLLSGCGGAGGDTVAATVGDTEISVADVRAFPFEAGSSIDSTVFAQYLGALIQWKIVEAAAADQYEVAPTDEETEAELQLVLTEQAGGLTLAEVAEQQQVSEGTIRQLVRVGLIQRQVAEQLAGEVEEPAPNDVAAAIEEARVGLTEVCVRHLLVGTEEEAVVAKARLEGGEDFATVAGQVSTDPSAAQNGGDLGCALAQGYVDEFRDAAVAAEIDAISEPVASQFGVHVLQVYDRTEAAEADLPTEDEVRQSLIEEAGTSQLQDWLLESVESADVTVEEEFGTWTLDPQPAVLPPAT